MAATGTVTDVFKVVTIDGQGKSLIATKALDKNTTLLIEAPLVSSQFAWNKFCDDKEIEDMMKGTHRQARRVSEKMAAQEDALRRAAEVAIGPGHGA